ncbi:cupin domain-containing protein [Glutamicibacter halophytocola]|uniref:Cupin domain-containing protein n=1 Tax=Glutamicibacter halophytocola TaxID=1933880 RepID=A0AA95BPW9_9MICC|nr:cupin domain-containing protein [Glutamicibacter halophytocola]UUX58751.1 cupin domain-containing protein [Glutamicibacter halophytocola]
MTEIDLERIHALAPVINALPGEPVPYYVASGEGERHEVGGQLVTVVARTQDTGGLFEAAFILGPAGAQGAGSALDAVQRSFFVVDGSVQATIAGRTRILVQGDSFHVAPGETLEYRLLSHMTRIFLFSAPGGALADLLGGGSRTEKHLFTMDSLSAADLQFPPGVEAAGSLELPQGSGGYFLSAGGGEHRAWPDALNSYLARPSNTGGRYFAVNTLAAVQPYIIRHFHRLHTENFVCLSGRVWLWVNGQEVLLTAGDFLHAPAGTIHSFAIGAHNTQMLGLLTGGVFEKFFDVTSEPTSAPVYSEGLVDPSTVIAGIQANPDLDLQVVGPPPERTLAPGL